jgi:hypothetical protein
VALEVFALTSTWEPGILRHFNLGLTSTWELEVFEPTSTWTIFNLGIGDLTNGENGKTIGLGKNHKNGN